MAAAVDVLIPAYNAASTLAESLASMTAQTIRDIRILVVDDGSTDGTPALLAALAAQDPRIAVIRRENGGIVEALNQGLAACTAEFVARFDSDDVAYPHRLERQLAYLQANPDCAAVGCDVDHIDEHGAPVEGLPRPGSPAGSDPAWIPAREPYLIHPYLFARRAAMLKAGGYRHVPNSEDSDLYWRMEEQGRLHNLEERLGKYRMHMGSISGASVTGGRVMAIGSQLGALSARRRRAGKPDIVFTKADAPALKAAGTLEAMHSYAAQRLEPAEADHLRLAAGIKLLELTGYRPYEIEASDCAFIRAAWPLAKRHPAFGEARWHVMRAAARLLKKGKAKEAMALMPPELYPRLGAVLIKG
jgi:hypothetical protein